MRTAYLFSANGFTIAEKRLAYRNGPETPKKNQSELQKEQKKFAEIIANSPDMPAAVLEAAIAQMNRTSARNNKLIEGFGKRITEIANKAGVDPLILESFNTLSMRDQEALLFSALEAKKGEIRKEVREEKRTNREKSETEKATRLAVLAEMRFVPERVRSRYVNGKKEYERWTKANGWQPDKSIKNGADVESANKNFKDMEATVMAIQRLLGDQQFTAKEFVAIMGKLKKEGGRFKWNGSDLADFPIWSDIDMKDWEANAKDMAAEIIASRAADTPTDEPMLAFGNWIAGIFR